MAAQSEGTGTADNGITGLGFIHLRHVYSSTLPSPPRGWVKDVPLTTGLHGSQGLSQGIYSDSSASRSPWAHKGKEPLQGLCEAFLPNPRRVRVNALQL